MHLTRALNPSKEGKYILHKFPIGASGLFGKDLNGKWKTKKILNEYALIFCNYKRYRDDTIWKQNKYAKKFLNIISKVIGKPILGWYDTHAKHTSVCT